MLDGTEETTQVSDGTEVPAGTQPDAEAAGGAEGAIVPESQTSEPAKEGAADPATLAKTYTEDEVKQREAHWQSEASKAQQAANRLRLQQRVDEMNLLEAVEREKDTRSVEAGVITQDEADQRQQIRLATAQEISTLMQLRQDNAGRARYRVAELIAEQYGVDVKALLAPDLTTPLAMKDKAHSLQTAALKAELRQAKAQRESYDRGGSAGQVHPMTATQQLKARYRNSPELSD